MESYHAISQKQVIIDLEIVTSMQGSWPMKQLLILTAFLDFLDFSHWSFDIHCFCSRMATQILNHLVKHASNIINVMLNHILLMNFNFQTFWMNFSIGAIPFSTIAIKPLCTFHEMIMPQILSIDAHRQKQSIFSLLYLVIHFNHSLYNDTYK